MADVRYLFVGFAGTLCDAAEFERAYRGELAGELADAAGGSADDWHAAIDAADTAAGARYAARFRSGDATGYADWWQCEAEAYARSLFAHAGRPEPTRETAAAPVARLRFDAAIRCDSAYEGAGTAMRILFERGVRTQTAAPDDAQFLIAALIGAGVESYIESKFGPDLVDCAREGPEFYARVFEALGIRPGQCAVLDCSPVCLEWAESAGAAPLQACFAVGAQPDGRWPAVRAMADLPDVVMALPMG